MLRRVANLLLLGCALLTWGTASMAARPGEPRFELKVDWVEGADGGKVYAAIKAGRGPEEDFRYYIRSAVRNTYVSMVRARRTAPAGDAIEDVIGDRGPDVASVKTQVTDLRSVMGKAGDGKAEIYLGELGWASTGPFQRLPERSWISTVTTLRR